MALDRDDERNGLFSAAMMMLTPRCWLGHSDREESTYSRQTVAIGSRPSPPWKRSEGEPTTDSRSKVVVGVVGDARGMRDRDGESSGYPGICNSGKTVETLGEVMI